MGEKIKALKSGQPPVTMAVKRLVRNLVEMATRVMLLVKCPRQVRRKVAMGERALEKVMMDRKDQRLAVSSLMSRSGS